MTSILGLVILIAIGAAVVRGSSRLSTSVSVGSATRGLFIYMATFVALMTGAIGLSGVLAGLVDQPAAGTAISGGELSSAVVGIPVFWALARSVLRRVRGDVRQLASQGWSLYINLVLFISLVVVLFFAFEVITDALAGDLSRRGLASLVVWVPILTGHRWAWRELGDSRRPDAYWFAGSVVGVGMTATSAIFILTTAVERIIDSLAPTTAALRDNDDLVAAFTVLALGAVTWAWHWLRVGASRPRTTGWLGYVVLVGVLGGVSLMYVGAVGWLISVLVWFLGEPATDSASRFFRDSAALGPIAVVGATTWWYHRAVLGPRRDEDRSEVDRLYDYLLAGVAVLVSAGAVTTLLVVVFSLLAPSSAVSAEFETANIVLSALALLAVGAPTWYLRWSDLQRRVAAASAEALSPVRRIYIFVILGVGGSVAFVSGIATLSVVFGAATGEQIGSVMASLRYPLAVLVGSIAFGGYHLRGYLLERNTVDRPRRRELIVVARDDADLVSLEALPGITLSRMVTSDADVRPPDAAAVAAALENMECDRALVIDRNGDLGVIALS